MLQKVKIFDQETSSRVLRRLLGTQYTIDETVVSFLLDRVNCCDAEHFEMALWRGHSERLINRMFDMLDDSAIATYRDSSRIVHGAFYAASSQGGKVYDETDLTYSEELIFKIIDKVSNIHNRYLETALARKFSEHNLKAMIAKVDS